MYGNKAEQWNETMLFIMTVDKLSHVELLGGFSSRLFYKISDTVICLQHHFSLLILDVDRCDNYYYADGMFFLLCCSACWRRLDVSGP